MLILNEEPKRLLQDCCSRRLKPVDAWRVNCIKCYFRSDMKASRTRQQALSLGLQKCMLAYSGVAGHCVRQLEQSWHEWLWLTLHRMEELQRRLA